MTFLDKAKREAKRLFKLAKDNVNSIHIESLAESQKIVAHLNGYNSWHDYEENLKRKEFIASHYEKSQDLVNHADNFSDYSDLYTQKTFPPNPIHTFEPFDLPLVKYERKHNSIYFGYYETGKLKKKKNNVYYNWSHKAVFGDTRTGRVMNMMVASRKYVAMSAGCIFTDASANNQIFAYYHDLCEELGRQSDLFGLNLMGKNISESHTIDMINPLVSKKDFFLKAFYLDSSPFSEVFYSMCRELHDKQISLDACLLKPFISIAWLQSLTLDYGFSVATFELIQNYLKLCGFYEVLNADMHEMALQKHHDHVIQCADMINLIEFYEKKGVFSVKPQINLESIFIHNQVLAVNFPDMEKPHAEIKNENITRLFYLNLFLAQDRYQDKMESKIVTNHRNYHQMALCIFDKAEYCFDSVTLPLLYKGLKNRYYHYTLGIEKASLFNTPEKSYIFSDISEYLFFKYDNPQEIPHIVQARVSYLVEKPLNLFHKDSRLLQSLAIGRGYLLSKNYHYKNGVSWDECFLQYFVLNYNYPYSSAEVKLYHHKS